MKKVIAKSSELVVLEHAPGELYELADSKYEDAPVIGIFFEGPDAQKLLEILSRCRPQDSMRQVLRAIKKRATQNISSGKNKL